MAAWILAFLILVAQARSEIASSVWCHGSHQDHRHCNFNNLCFSPHFNQYLFFHSTEKSVISGVDDPSEQIKLVRLSSVMGHAGLYLDYVPMPSSASDDFDIEFIDNPTLLLRRWNPGDLFSALHDDLLPIYETMKYFCYGQTNVESCLKDFILAFDDFHVEGRFNDLYTSLFPNVIFLQRFLSYEENMLVCFKKATVGLETDSLWYDHGFSGVNGPLNDQHNEVTPTTFEDFRNFVLGKFDIPQDIPSGRNKAAIIKDSKIVNLNELAEVLERKGFEVRIVDNATMSAQEIISEISDSKVLIGFAGGINSLALFLPKNCGIVEIFPFGLDQSSLPAISILAFRRGLVYQSMIDFVKPPGITGNAKFLKGLDKTVAEAVLNLEHVGPVPCCSDPGQKYKLSQRTRADPRTFEDTLNAVLSDIKSRTNDVVSEEEVSDWIIPGAVSKVECQVDEKQGFQVRVRWNPPLNLKYLMHNIVSYEITADAKPYDSSSGNDFIGQFSSRDPSITFSSKEIDLRKHQFLQVYIVTVLADLDLRGSDVVVNCNLDPIEN